MAFSSVQVKKLSSKLPERFIKTRVQRGQTLSYIEGWHVIDEANRIFGFDGWDRETLWSDCVWQDARINPKACTYAVRVRIRVRAGEITISREGSGVGHGTGATLGEAHESALKEAETDATKRAFTTFGNLFGLALYDKAQQGVQRAKSAGEAPATRALTAQATGTTAGARNLERWVLLTNSGVIEGFATPQAFCSAAKAVLNRAATLAEIEALWTGNNLTLMQLRRDCPELATSHGTHYADLLEGLYHQRRQALDAGGAAANTAGVAAGADGTSGTVIAAAFPLQKQLRLRDPAHRQYVASLPCLICGRSPSQAHHLRFAQPRAMSSKVSDEWVVPLCPIHHRSLHDMGVEQEWWQAKGIDPIPEAEKLWRERHPVTTAAAAQSSAVAESDTESQQKTPAAPIAADKPGERPSDTTAVPSSALPSDSQNRPIPVNLHVMRPALD